MVLRTDTVITRNPESLKFTHRVVQPYVDVSRIAKLSFEEKKRLSNESIDLYMAAAAEPEQENRKK